MSRVGKLPIEVPAGVTITVDDTTTSVQGPKGTLTMPTLAGITISQEGTTVTVSRADDSKELRAKHG